MANESIVRIVLNAVDNFTSVFTGLNQGLELVGKAFTGLQTVAVGSFNLIKGGLESVADGGDYLEMRNQFESVAKSFGHNGQQIADIFDDVGQGAINATSKIQLASKAVSSGLSGDEIRSVAEYTKKWTEAAGEDFEQMSRQVFEALNSGKYSVLKQMGLLIEKGTSATDVISQMRSNMSLFSDTGKNVADSMGAISTAVEDFVLYIKAAIANSDTLQRALDYLAEGARDFVKSFDYSTVTQFFETIIKAAGIVFDALKEVFAGIGQTIYDVFKGLRTQGGVKEFFQSLGKYALEGYKAFAEFASGTAEVFSTLSGSFGLMVKWFGTGFHMIETIASKVLVAITQSVQNVFHMFSQSLNTFIAAYPNAAQLIPGIDQIANGFSGITSAAHSAKGAMQTWQDSVNGTDSLGQSIEQWGTGIEDFAIKMDASRGRVKDFTNTLQQSLEKGFKDFEVAPKKGFLSDEVINRTAEQGQKLQEMLRKNRDKQDAEEAAKSEKAAKKRITEAEREEEKKQKIREDAMRATLRDIEALERKISQYSYYSLTVDESNLLKSKDQIKKIVEQLDLEAQRERLRIALDTTVDPAKIQAIKKEMDKLNIDKDGKLTIKADAKKPEPVPLLIKLFGGPTFFKELIQNMVMEAKGERVPFTFTAVPS